MQISIWTLRSYQFCFQRPGSLVLYSLTHTHTHTLTLIYTVPFSGLKYIALIIVSLLSLLHVVVTYTNICPKIYSIKWEFYSYFFGSLNYNKLGIQVKKADLKEAEHDRKDVLGMRPQMFISWDSVDDLQDKFP